jgi:hypothetical protein
LARFADTLLVRKKHEKERPDFLSPADESKLLTLLDWYVEQQSRDGQLTKLMSYYLLETIQERFKQHRECPKKPSESCEFFYLMSVSDINIVALLGVLGVPSNKNVPYTAMLTLRFNRRQEVSVTLNDVPQRLPGCGVTCSPEQWNQLVASAQSVDWPDLCWPTEPEAH